MFPFDSMSLLCYLFVLMAFMGTIDSEQPPSIYEALKANGLPVGLLPKGITDFYIDDDGRFEIRLDRDCNAKFESELHYERNVSGVLSYGQIGEMSGVIAQDLFLWFPVKSVRVDVPSSGIIYFDVDVVYKQFSLSMFETPPDCMAGDDESGGVSDRKMIDQGVFKRESGKYWYQNKQEDFGRDVQ